MGIFSFFRRVAGAALAVFACVAGAAQANEPVIAFESLLDTPFHPSGVIAFDTLDVVFAPPPPAKAEIQIVKKGGGAVAQFRSHDSYRLTDNVFARMSFVGPAHAQLTEPGDYEIRVSINGKPAAAMPFTAKVSGGGDPFSTEKTWTYEGPWTQWGYLSLRDHRDTQVVDVVYWTGKGDLAPGTKKDTLKAYLLRNGKVIGQSSGYNGHIADERFRRHSLALLEPHEDGRSPNAAPIDVRALAQPGQYELRLERGSDRKTIRSFRFASKDGKPVSHPRTEMTYRPVAGYIAPRVVKKGSNTYQFVPAAWIESK